MPSKKEFEKAMTQYPLGPVRTTGCIGRFLEASSEIREWVRASLSLIDDEVYYVSKPVYSGLR